MPRQNLIRSSVFPYHVVNRLNNREWFTLPMEQVWRVFSGACWEISLLTDARIHAFVLMSNHYHLMLSTPGPDLGEVMQRFACSITRIYNLISGREGHLFNGRYRWSLIGTSRYYAHALKYVYRNPVKAGIVDQVEEYPFSTLYARLGQGPASFPLFHPGEGAGDALIPELASDQLGWLNSPFRPEDENAIRKALRRKAFELPRLGAARAPSPLETRLA
jgi:REP element-mobilizing transposase RayT